MAMSTADLPADMRVTPTQTSPTPLAVQVLTCQHGPACPSCVLAVARVLIEEDASLVQQVYTG